MDSFLFVNARIEDAYREIAKLRKQLQEQSEKNEDLFAIIKEQQIEIEEYKQQMEEHKKFIINALHELYAANHGSTVNCNQQHAIYEKLKEMME